MYLDVFVLLFGQTHVSDEVHELLHTYGGYPVLLVPTSHPPSISTPDHHPHSPSTLYHPVMSPLSALWMPY